MSFVGPQLREDVRASLADYCSSTSVIGLRNEANFDTFLRQILDSIRRVEYFFALQARDISPTRADPRSPDFDPIRAAVLHLRSGNLDEAAWLAFLLIHFGSHRRTKWRLVREVYGRLGQGHKWDWKTVRTDVTGFTQWLAAHRTQLTGRFGNHRKYMSLKPAARGGTVDAFRTYVAWVQGHTSHAHLLASFQETIGNDRGALFHACYSDMLRNVRGFARTGCFDYLCTLGKLNAFPIEPRSPYIAGSTGPRQGAELLLAGSPGKTLRPSFLDGEMQRLGHALADTGVRFSMQVLEDALCNWQKSPSSYEAFHG